MLAPWFDRHGDERPRIVNMYGITETTVHVTHRTMARGDLARPSVSVIGRPIPDLQVWIVGEDGKPSPPGTVGEIHVGGPGVARGYLRRPELTRERFIENPFASREESGGRLYKSGDLGRLRPDGELEYLGRADQQMKIRGHRIEPAEVESALREHPAIREAVVAAAAPREGPDGEAVLIACVVLSEDARPTGPDLRGFLRTKLPESMIPASFAVFDSLPLTSNGKLDRASLTAAAAKGARPLPEGSSPTSEDPLHAALARIWMQALGIPSVGSADDFFALGGDSLRAARVMARVRDDFQVELPLRAIFESRTIERLAASVEAARAAGKVAPVRPRIRPVSRNL
jgi:acyl-CoA synthetase (AMP-forming)/AMP-acid ligase II/acyl carrier protein